MVGRVLITGSNRGIGLEFVRQYLECGWHVYATCRRPAEAQSLHLLLELHRRLSIHRLDITLEEDISNLLYELDNIPLDLLINNAAVSFRRHGSAVDCIHYDDWRRTLEVNTLGTVRVTESLLGNVRQSRANRLIVALSSHMTTISDSSLFYRSSKAALNAGMLNFAAALREQEIGVLLLHPGAVLTRMGPAEGISTRESVSCMRQIIASFTMEQSGRLYNYDGQELPW